MRSVKICCLTLALLMFFPVRPANSQPSLTLSDEASISLITIYPGQALYELFAHSGIRVRDPIHDFDLLYNYGTFQFDGSFLPKFVYGKLDYMLWVSDFRRELQRYRIADRSVVEQTLALNHEQRQAIFDFLQYNALEENRSYRYDFLFDNCSTRIRDVLERTLGDSLQYGDPPAPDQTFRELLDPYLAARPFLDLGIDLTLGAPTDRTASQREAMFLPIYLMDALENTYVDGGGALKPLVARNDTIYWSDTPPTIPNRAPLHIFVWGVFALSLWVSNGASRSALAARLWFDRLLFGFGGLAGLLVLFLWIVSLHTVANDNWNLLWAWPTHLIAIFALTQRPPWLSPYMRIYAVVVFITALGWYFWPQGMNNALLPVLLACLVRSAWWGFRKGESASLEMQALTDPQA